MPIRLSRRINNVQRRQIRYALVGLPHIPGSPIFVSVKPQLTAYRGTLLSRHPELGSAVHAASFIRKRKIVLEEELFQRPPVLSFILAHELLHFVWPRLSNELREEYSHLLHQEFERGAKGELGESSEVRKESVLSGLRCWREYVCESFCDTGAWFYCDVAPQPEFRLAKRWCKARSRWFTERFARYWRTRYL